MYELSVYQLHCRVKWRPVVSWQKCHIEKLVFWWLLLYWDVIALIFRFVNLSIFILRAWYNLHVLKTPNQSKPNHMAAEVSYCKRIWHLQTTNVIYVIFVSVCRRSCCLSVLSVQKNTQFLYQWKQEWILYSAFWDSSGRLLPAVRSIELVVQNVHKNLSNDHLFNFWINVGNFIPVFWQKICHIFVGFYQYFIFKTYYI